MRFIRQLSGKSNCLWFKIHVIFRHVSLSPVMRTDLVKPMGRLSVLKLVYILYISLISLHVLKGKICFYYPPYIFVTFGKNNLLKFVCNL